MITVREYLDADKHTKMDVVRAYNKELIEKYPFLLPRNVQTGKLHKDYNYEFTWMDEMPEGWRIAFGDKMLEELREELIKHKYEKDEFDESGDSPVELEIRDNGFEDTWLNHYFLVQIKEKYGSLRWYTGGAPQEIHDIVDKYETLSGHTCIECGEPAEFISTGWICPWCSKCAHKRFADDERFCLSFKNQKMDFNQYYVSIEDWFKKESEII